MQLPVRAKHFLACDQSLGKKNKRAVCQTPIYRQSVALMLVGGTGTGCYSGEPSARQATVPMELKCQRPFSHFNFFPFPIKRQVAKSSLICFMMPYRNPPWCFFHTLLSTNLISFHQEASQNPTQKIIFSIYINIMDFHGFMLSGLRFLPKNAADPQTQTDLQPALPLQLSFCPLASFS